MSSFSPLDLLAVSAGEQKILRQLTKTPDQTVGELSILTDLPASEIESTLVEMRNAGRVMELLRDGSRVFSTRFQFRRPMVRNMPGEIMDLFEQPTERFFHETPLARDLSADAVSDLLQLSQKRTYQPNEVVAWQGQKIDILGVVQRGLLSHTRLKGRPSEKSGGYFHRHDWIGLMEAWGDIPLAETITATTETILLTWPVLSFIDMVKTHHELALSLADHLNLRLRDCQQSHLSKQSKLWVFEGVGPKVGISTLATNLALLTRQQEGSKNGRTLFWSAANPLTAFPTVFGPPTASTAVGLAQIEHTTSGIDVLIGLNRNSYSPQVQLDMLLNSLLSRYEYIICDSGTANTEFLLRLRGQAHTLLTVTADTTDPDLAINRWQQLKPFSFPAQKRVLTLNKATVGAVEIDARFQLLIPFDDHHENFAAGGPLKEALAEVYRRLSLNHAVALFVPSTMSVDQAVDNTSQVQETLSFLGSLFGGATRSDAEGAWRSEDSGLVTEQVTVVRTFVSQQALDSHLDEVLNFAVGLKRRMKQEAVAISVDNQLILV